MNLFKKLHGVSGFFSKKLNIIYKIKNFTRVFIMSLLNNIFDYYLHKTIIAGDLKINSYFEGSS
jgi:hypothetical protein